MFESVLIGVISSLLSDTGLEAYRRIVQRMRASQPQTFNVDLLPVVNTQGDVDPESVARILSSVSPDQAVKTVVVLQGIADRLSHTRPAEPSEVEHLTDDMIVLGELNVPKKLRMIYVRSLAEAFPWAESDQLEAVAYWCALRDRSEDTDDLEERAALGRDGEILNQIFGRPPAFSDVIA